MGLLADGPHALKHDDHLLSRDNTQNGAAILTITAPFTFTITDYQLPAIAFTPATATTTTPTPTKSTTTTASARLLGTRFIHG